MPTQRIDRDVQPLELRVGFGAGPALGGMHRRGSPAEVPPNKFWSLINARIVPEGVVSREGLVLDVDANLGAAPAPIDGLFVRPDDDGGDGERLVGLTAHLSRLFYAGQTVNAITRELKWQVDPSLAASPFGAYLRPASYRPMVKKGYREQTNAGDPRADVFYNAMPTEAQRIAGPPYTATVDWYFSDAYITRPVRGPKPLDWLPPVDGVYPGRMSEWGFANLIHFRGQLTHVGHRFFPRGTPSGDPWSTPNWDLCLALCEIHFPETIDKEGHGVWTKIANPDIDPAGTGLMDVAVRRCRVAADRINEILTLAVLQQDGTLKVFDWDGTTCAPTGLTVAAGAGTLPGVATAALAAVGDTGLFLICQYFAPQTNAAVAFYQSEPGAAWVGVALPAGLVCYGIVPGHEGVYFDYGTIGDWEYPASASYPDLRDWYPQRKLGFWKPGAAAFTMIRNWWTQAPPATGQRRVPLTTAPALGVGEYQGIAAHLPGMTSYSSSSSPAGVEGMFFWRNKLWVWLSSPYSLGRDNFEGHFGDIPAYIDAWNRDEDDEPPRLDSYDGSTYTEAVNIGIAYPYARVEGWQQDAGGTWVPTTAVFGWTDFVSTGVPRAAIEVAPGVFRRSFEWLGPAGGSSWASSSEGPFGPVGESFQGPMMAALVQSPLFDASPILNFFFDHVPTLPPGPGPEVLVPFEAPPGGATNPWLALGAFDPEARTWGLWWRIDPLNVPFGDVEMMFRNVFQVAPSEEQPPEVLAGLDHPGPI